MLLKIFFCKLYSIFKLIFHLLLEKEIFPDDLKIAKVTPVFKGGDRSELGKC